MYFDAWHGNDCLSFLLTWYNNTGAQYNIDLLSCFSLFHFKNFLKDRITMVMTMPQFNEAAPLLF